jgi:hypothetical protein
MKHLGLGLIALAAAYNGGCTGTDTGNPHDGGESTGSERCDEVRRELALGESTSLGVTARDVLDLASGEHRETLAWLVSPNGVAYGPESGTGEITIVVEPRGGARFIERTPKGQGSDREEVGIDLFTPEDQCPDAIEVDVRLHILTAGGALDETLDTTLDATSGELVVGNVRLPTDGLAGSFEVHMPVPAGFELSKAPELILTLGISAYGAVGELGVVSEIRSTDGAVAGQTGVPRLAHFPAENFCGSSAISVERDQVIRGISIQGVLDRLNAQSPASLTPGGAALSLEFSTSAERMCVLLGAPKDAPLPVEFPGRVRLSAPDENIEGSIVVSFAAEALDGQLVSVSANANAFANDPVEAAALASDFAIQEPLDLSRYDGGAFEFATTSESSAGVSGVLRAYGLLEPDCANQTPVATPGGGMSSPGCAGTERIELWGFTWGASGQGQNEASGDRE